MRRLRLAKLREEFQQALQFGFLQLPDPASEPGGATSGYECPAVASASRNTGPKSTRSWATLTAPTSNSVSNSISASAASSMSCAGSGSTAATSALAMRSFGGGDQLDHFFRASKPILNFVGIRAQSFRRQGCGYARL